MATTQDPTYLRLGEIIAMKEDALTLSNRQRDEAQAEVRRLQKIIDALPAPPPPPPPVDPPPPPPPVDPPPVPTPTKRMLLGATFDPHTPLTRDATITAWENTCGHADIARVFLSSAPTTGTIAGALAPHYNRRHRILSYKGEGTDAVLSSVQKDGFNTYLVKYHEPENDGGTHTPAWFRQVQDEEITQVKALQAAGRKDLIASFVLMGWADNDNSAATSSTLWFPSIVDDVVMLLDPYPAGALGPYVRKSVDLWRAAGGTRWGIAEMAWHQQPSATLAKLITEGLTAVRQMGAECACWFHSAVNGVWWLDDPLGQAAWKAQTLV